ncbi:MAG: class I SAM-dependent methyltransferase [Ruminococcus sp.]|nr:class I SAM-dependent methyltransferase [Ruminococcus sp.]
MGKIHIEKGSVQETLIIPLYARKLCAEQFPTLYQDKYAKMICESIDYDFSDIEAKKNNKMYQFGGLEGAMREKDMLWEIADYLKNHPKAAVVNLGCGLNMTGRTADNGSCKIYNLDFPDVIKARNEIIPAGDREENIICDLNDHSWMDKIDAENGVVLYAAGVFHYFTAQQIKDMVVAMAEKFPGGRLVFDAVGKFGRDKLMKGTLKSMGMNDVSGLFCVSDKSELEGWSPKVELKTKKSYMQGYYKLEDPNIKGIHRFLAKLCDSLAKMYVYQMEFTK